MKISYRWVKEFVDFDLPAQEVADILTNVGLEVEGIERTGSSPAELEGVVVGHVMEVRPHPNADRLRITKVNVGEEEPLQIVCGAPNVAEGQKVPVALVGSTLPMGGDKPLKIKKAKIRGERSVGMICAEDELGIGTNHSGIMVLPEEVEVGRPVTDYLRLQQDWVLDVAITPNRGDAASHLGVARDLAAFLRQPLKVPQPAKVKAAEQGHQLTVEVESPQDCPRYAGVVLEGLEVKPSPEWMQQKLRAVGLEPRNNVVDVTNYVMYELGQPLHAFDFRMVEGNSIRVRRSKKGEVLQTLDGKDRKLTGQELLICNANEPIGIAGVMGGKGSGVKESTSAIFLESAVFDPTLTRKTAHHYNLHSDAAFRFIRGVDPNLPMIALQRAVELLQETAGGKVASAVYDVYPQPVQPVEVELKFSYLTKLIGTEIPREEVKEILEHLDFSIKEETEEALTLAVPTVKTEVTRPADVAEEVLRIWGINKVPVPERVQSSLSFSPEVDPRLYNEHLAEYLIGRGFYEIFNVSLTAESTEELLQTGKKPVRPLNPLSQDLNVLRTNTLGSGLEAIRQNVNRQQRSLKLFEIGTTYHATANGYEEEQHLALFTTGKVTPEHWREQQQEADFFYLKGVVEELTERLGLTLEWKEGEQNAFAFISTGQVEGQPVVHLGRVHSKVCQEMDIEEAVYAADFLLEPLYMKAAAVSHRYKPVSRFPSVTRDLALLVPRQVSFARIEEEIREQGQNLLESVRIFDVYESKKLGKNRKSYAIRMVFRDPGQTLKDERVEYILEKLINKLSKELNASIRE